MKKTAKRFLSLLLTVCLLMGSIVMIVPATIISVSAEGEYTDIPANTTVSVNGINIRYDQYPGNDDGYVHVFADGTIEFKIRHGDMVWFPDLVMTNDSEVHAEFTVLEGTKQHSGVAFNVVKDGLTWASANVVGFNNGARVRVAGDTRENLGNDNGNDGYGSGGNKRPINGYINDQVHINSGKAFPDNYNYVKNPNNEVAVGKTVSVDLKRSNIDRARVSVEWSAVGYGAFYADWYTDSLDANTSYLYAGGSVGYTMLYQNYDNAYIVRRFEKLTVTNCNYNGSAITNITLAGFVNVTPNTDFVYNGRTYRLDVASCGTEHTDSFAHINSNGTIELNLHHGDMLWFPDVRMSSYSKVHAEVTAKMEMKNRRSGVAYAVRPNDEGVWENTMVAVMNTACRVRITAATSENLTRVSGNDYGQGGTDRAFNDAGVQTYYTQDSYKYIESNTTNHDWGKGKTLSFDISSAYGTVTVDWGNPNIGTFTSHNYMTSSKDSYSYSGSVGYTVVNVDTGSDNPVMVCMERMTVTNCTVNGEFLETWDAVGREMPAHTNTVVDGVTYRFDPLEGHTTSSCWIMDDNTFRVRMQAGDLFWLPETERAAGASLTAKMINNNGQKNMGNLAAGIAYNIDTSGGDPDAWDDSSDSLNTAHLQTSWRRRVCYTTAGGANTSQTKLGTYSTYTLEAANRNTAYWGFNDRWNVGDIVKIDLSISDGGMLKFSFRDGNDIQMTYDNYEIGSGDHKVMGGPIGFYPFWDGDGSERYAMTVDILKTTLITDGVSDAAVSTSLDGIIGLNFKFQAMPFVAAEGKVVITKAGKEIMNVAVSDLWNESESAYVCTVPVFAKEMTDKVNISIMMGEEIYNGHSYTMTVKQYAQALSEADPSWADLMNAMLAYGAAAQKQFGYKTNNLAADISGGIEYDASEIMPFAADGDFSEFIIGVNGTLTLESGTDINLYLQPVDEGAVFEATATDSYLSPVDLTIVKEEGEWKITIDDLKAEELGNVFYITVTDGTNSVTFNYSALNWVRSAINSSTASANTKTLARAIGVYAAEAQKKK